MEMLTFPADHSLDGKTAPQAASFRATASNFHFVSSHIQSLSKTVVNITNNLPLCLWFCSFFQLMNGKLLTAKITKMGLEAALTFWRN